MMNLAPTPLTAALVVVFLVVVVLPAHAFVLELRPAEGAALAGTVVPLVL